ncbi:MAG: DNA polymerase III subunit beta [Actinobacteria bacterium]|nr:DNA polymerase III subunit beta [Actinomycetota bacterium]
MHIEGEKEALLEVGQSVLRAVSPRATLPVLGGVKIEAGRDNVKFVATDLEMFLTVQGDFAVKEQGAVVVPGRLFGDILRNLPSGKVSIRGADGEVRIEAGRSEFAVTGFPVADFPSMPEVKESQRCQIAGAELARALRQVVRAASPDEGRPVLTGVLWSVEGSTLRLVATDSYRLAVRELVIKEGAESGTAIIPGRALAEFGRHLAGIGEDEVSVWLGDSQAVFSAGSTTLVTRLIDGEFPDYRKLIPESHTKHLKVATEPFAQAVERVGLVARENTPVKIHLGEEVQLTATEAGVADAWEALEEVEFEGDPMVIAFNPRFLSDGLEGLESQTAVMEVTDPARPAVLKGVEREEFIYLLMPVRLPG